VGGGGGGREGGKGGGRGGLCRFFVGTIFCPSLLTNKRATDTETSEARGKAFDLSYI